MLVRLAHKRIVLGVTGGIAAYKSAELIRRLRDAGAEVQVVMTAAAQQFITPLTLQALSGKPVHTDLLDPTAEAAMSHIDLARWADLVLVAPASADFIARLAQGVANDLLSTLWLATKARLAVAPAMNQQIWAAPSVQDNLAVLRRRGVAVFGPAAGAQACGDVGEGRMLEAVELAEHCASQFESGLLTGRHVVITAGPTREALDPVRYLSNHSSGKMGFAIARACVEAGARVTLIAGPVTLPPPDRVTQVNVVSALEMLESAQAAAVTADIFIATAAVADYRPVDVANQKIKKSSEVQTLSLVKNPDIVATIAALPHKPFVVGFAAETENLLAHAREKLVRKHLDMIACNDVARSDIGFQSDDNALTVIWSNGDRVLEKAAKSVIASQLVALIAERMAARPTRGHA
jgi:phosphopantothenoylcysteine decarboxylase/phosphopantothenate--cysteine ligase